MPYSGAYQRQFHARYGHLRDAHVRDMAWLLTSPDLLDGKAPQWHDRIASLQAYQGAQLDDWLRQVDDDPTDLHSLIARHGFNRLGRYSELLMAFFLRHLGLLQAHGLQVQVRAGKNETVGEFDFLLWSDVPEEGTHPELLHWEFATKYYLLESTGTGRHADYLVGPNLADSLGAKMRKILERQLALSLHPAARALLPQAIASAQALVKGWLFYPVSDRDQDKPLLPALGVAEDHCRGFWRPLDQVDEIGYAHYVILPRLQWLAPAFVPIGECMGHTQLQQALAAHFAHDSLPVMIALMEQDGANAFEIERGFIVPNDWRGRANQFVQPR